ncbi:MAG: DnaA regulatory inactivator Hda [Methylococcales bacterium]|nr:DnaA regulatory inactivator Hda [Methylococcales bacterium]
MAEQLPLQFEFNTQQTFHNYYPGSNQEIVAHLQEAIIHRTEQLIFLWGEPGLGKTHLLRASCQLAYEQQQSSFMISLNPEALPDVSILDDLDAIESVCIDNIDAIAGIDEWEHAFFNFFNRHRDNDQHLILSASSPPVYLTVQLADLKTRLNWGLTLKLKALTDNDSLGALTFKADSLGFEISPQVGRFLLTHFARDLPSLWALLDRLDVASLAAKRKLTLPFLKQLLKTPSDV